MLNQHMLGKRIRAAREHAGIGQAELAKAVGCSTTWMWKIEDGRETPGLDLLRRIARELNVTLDSLACDESDAATDAPEQEGAA